MVTLQLGSFNWPCSFACISVLASLYKQSDILIHTGDSFDVGAQGFSLLQDGQTEKGSGKPAGPLFE